MALGGRSAEEIVFGDVSTGAMNDLERVTETATAMVTRYGMSDLIGPLVVGRAEQQPFLGRQLAGNGRHSEELARRIDREVRRLVEEAHGVARGVLEEHADELERVAHALMEEETIDRAGFEQLLGREEPAEDVPLSRDGDGADVPTAGAQHQQD